MRYACGIFSTKFGLSQILFLSLLTNLKNALASLKENQITQWQNDLNTYINLQEEMKTAMSQTIKEENQYVTISPVTGVLDQFNGIYSGSLISAGTTIAVVSPDSTLYAEIYVSPRNIGYIRNGMERRFNIDTPD
jgi:HlyD family secretion protein